jgi:hypothetical protein
MNRDARRRERDPIWWQQVRARLAQIKVVLAAKRIDEYAQEVTRPNMIESALLRARLEGGDHREQHRPMDR